MKVTASIVLYHTDKTKVANLLNCILFEPVDINIYIIDNSDVNQNYDFSHYDRVNYIKSPKNLGYGAGHNIALKLFRDTSDFHFVINPDISFASGELVKMLSRMSSDDSVGQLMPKVYYPNGELQYLAKLLPTPFDLVARRFLGEKVHRFFNPDYDLRVSGYEREMNVPYLSGCFMLFKMQAIKNIGYFDESFFMYPEDIDITRRMHFYHKTIYYPNANVIHEHAKGSYKSPYLLYLHISNMIKYFNKWGWFFDAYRKKINRSTLESITKVLPTL